LEIACRNALTEVEEIRRAKDEIEQITHALKISVDDQDNQSYLQQVDIIMKRTNKRASSIKNTIKVLKDENEKTKANSTGSIEMMWKKNSLRHVVTNFQSAMTLYSNTLDHFNRTIVNQCLRQHSYLNSDLSQEDIEAMQIDPIRAHNELILKLEEYGVSDSTIDKIANMEEQNSQMREIERGVKLIARLFEELNLMVIEQGDMLDSIENNVEASRLFVKKAVDEIDKSHSYAKKARQKKCCVFVCCLGILVVVVLMLFGV